MKFNPDDHSLNIAASMFYNYRVGNRLQSFYKLAEYSEYFGEGFYIMVYDNYYYFEKSGQLICDENGEYYKLPIDYNLSKMRYIANDFIFLYKTYYNDHSIYKIAFLVKKANDTMQQAHKSELIQFELTEDFHCAIVWYEHGEVISVVNWGLFDSQYEIEISHFEEICGDYNSLVNYLEGRNSA